MRVRTELRLVPEVPLPNQRRAVAIVLEQLRQRAAGRAQPLLLRDVGGTDGILDARSLLVAAADQHRARRRTIRRGIEVGEPRAVSGKAVEKWRLDIR